MKENKTFINPNIFFPTDLTNMFKELIEQDVAVMKPVKNYLNLPIVKSESFHQLVNLEYLSKQFQTLKLPNIHHSFDIENLITTQEKISSLYKSISKSNIYNPIIDLNVSQEIFRIYDNLNAYIIKNDLDSPYEAPEFEDSSSPMNSKNTYSIVLYIIQTLIWIYGLITSSDQKEYIIQNIILIQLQLAVIMENKINSHADDENKSL